LLIRYYVIGNGFGDLGKGTKRIFLCLGAAAPQATMASHNFFARAKGKGFFGAKNRFWGSMLLTLLCISEYVSCYNGFGGRSKTFFGGWGIGRCGYVPIAFCICVRLTLSYYDIQELFTV